MSQNWKENDDDSDIEDRSVSEKNLSIVVEFAGVLLQSPNAQGETVVSQSWPWSVVHWYFKQDRTIKDYGEVRSMNIKCTGFGSCKDNQEIVS